MFRVPTPRTWRVVLLAAAGWLLVMTAAGAAFFGLDENCTVSGTLQGGWMGALTGATAGFAVIFVPLAGLLLAASFGKHAAGTQKMGPLAGLLAALLGGVPGGLLGLTGGVVVGAVSQQYGHTWAGSLGGAGFGSLNGAVGSLLIVIAFQTIHFLKRG